MFCRKCGKTIPDDSVFCPYCGEAVNLVKSLEPIEQEKSSVETAFYGRCEECGKPREADDGALCKVCAAEITNQYAPNELTNELYPYGSCGKCTSPLEADDKCGVCKNCLLDLQYEEKKLNGEIPSESKGFYTPYPVKPKSYYSTTSEDQPKKHTGCLVATLVCTGIVIVIALSCGISQSSPVAGTGVTSIEPSSAATSSSSLPNSSASTTTPEAKPDLELLGDECTVDNFSTHITGTVKNNTSKQFTYVQIQFSLYDKNDNQIGTALANMNGLEPGGVWKFNAIGLKSDTEKYKLLSLKAY